MPGWIRPRAITSPRWLLAPIALVLLLAAASGCSKRRGPMLPVEPVTLVVRNHSYFDVAVYTVLASVDSRSRIATVGGNSERRVTIPGRNLLPGRMMRLYAHAIGSRGSWVSPTITVDLSSIACLDLYASPDGDLSRSAFFTMPMVITETDSAGTTGIRPATVQTCSVSGSDDR